MSLSSMLVAHAALTWAMTGLIWTIQLVHYPLFAGVRGDLFPAWHRRHTLRITLLAAPGMLGEALTAGLLLLGGCREPAFLWSLPLLVVIFASTFLVQVPLHGRMAAGWDPEAHAALVRTNWWRTVAWSVRAVLVGACLV